MRLGIILEGRRLPPAEVQRGLLTERACDVIAHEARMTPDARRRISRLIHGLRRGDELAVAGLDVFDRTTGDLVVLLRNLFQVGVTLRLVASDEDDAVLPPDDSALTIASALAEHEARRAMSEKAVRRRRGESGRRLGLTNHQIEYARKLYAEGASPRSIGLIFQATPDEVWQIVGD